MILSADQATEAFWQWIDDAFTADSWWYDN
jgi:hypothetical protein